MALFDRHRLVGGQAAEIVPWGKKVAPKVGVEFTLGGHEYKVIKRFVEKPMSQLYVDGQLKAEGDPADEAILEIVGGKAPGKGMSKTVHLGLAGILWAPQGDVHLTKKPEWDSEVVSEFAAPSSVIQGKKEREFQSKLDSYMGEHFTPQGLKTGRIKKASPIKSMQEKIEALDDKIKEVFEITQRLESNSKEVQKDEDNLGIIVDEISELDERLEETREHLDDATAGIQALQKQEVEVERLTREYNALRERTDRFEQLKKEKISMREKRNEIKETISDKKLEIKPIEKRISKLKDMVRSLSTQEKEKDIDIEKAISQEQLREKEEQLKEVEDIITESEKIMKEIENLKGQIDELNAPEKEDVEEIQTIRRQISNLEFQLKSLGLKLEFMPKKSVKGKILLDGKEEKFLVTSKKPGDWVAARSAEIDMVNIGKLNITSGAIEQEKLEQELAETRVVVENHLLSSFSDGTLNNLLAQEQQIEKQISNLQAEYKGKMGKRPQSKIKKANKLKKEIKQLKKRVGKPKRKLNLSNLKDELKTIQTAYDESQKELESFKNDREEIRESIRGMELNLKEIEVWIENNKAEMARIEDDGYTPTQRTKELGRRLSELEKAKEKYQALYERYGDLQEKLKKDGKRFEDAKAKCRKKLDDCKQAVISKKTEIAMLQEKADHVELARLKERRSELQNQLKSKELYLDGLKLLYERIQRKRVAVAQQVHAPLERRINHLLRSITGLKYEGIEFDQNLAPTGVRVSGIEELEPWERLSYGLREQVSVLTRLALGEITGDNEKQLVILDDPLVNTDDQRMVEMFNIFEALADKLQLVIFTCHGRNYRPLNATKLELVRE